MPSDDVNLTAIRASANSGLLQFALLTKIVDVVDVDEPDAVLLLQDKDKAMFVVWVEEVVEKVVAAVLVVEALEEGPLVS